MNESITVHVVDYGRSNLYMRYTDPITGKQIAKSTGTKKKAEAVKVAAKWEAELQEGRYKSPSKVTWAEFREAYERDLAEMSASYDSVMSATFNRFEELGIEKMAHVDINAIDRFKEILRQRKVSESTVRSYLKHLKAALRWAVKRQMLTECPQIEMPKRARSKSKMKGRPITTEEFERIIRKVPDVRKEDSAKWVRYLNGLWLSGLRRTESLILSWDDDADFSVDLYGRHPRFRILEEGQKAQRDELLPMTPDFAEWLLQTPVEERYGRVFPMGATSSHVGRIVSQIAKKANVKATAHDFRRSFGTRWSKLVKASTLQKLMRHADIKTTMDFYVSHEADDIGDELHRLGNTLGNTSVESSEAQLNFFWPPSPSGTLMFPTSFWQRKSLPSRS